MKRLLPLLLWLVLTVPAHATSFIQMPDQALLDQAALVIEGKVLGTMALSREPGDSTVYRIAVSRYLKGQDDGEVAVYVPGSLVAGDNSLFVPGMPRFTTGEEVLLFLNPRGDGTYDITQLVLGAFHQQTTGSGEPVAVRELSDSFELPGNGLGVLLPAADQKRDWTQFANWLSQTARGGSQSPTYWNATSSDGEATQANFTMLGTPPSRWFEFDTGQSVTLRANSSGQAGLSGGGAAQFQTGLAAWTNDAGSSIRYVYGSTTTANGGLQTADGVNAILFNDPNGEISGSFSCTTGGVIASGGFRVSGTGSHASTNFNRISEADIVVQDNAGCFLADNGGSNAQEVFAHELGHTLGLGHSCGDRTLPILGISDCANDASADDALMRATPHVDGRGADLRADDEAGAAYLYPPSAAGGGGTDDGGGTTTGGGDGGGGGGGGALDLLLLILLSACLSLPIRRLAQRRAPDA